MLLVVVPLVVALVAVGGFAVAMVVRVSGNIAANVVARPGGEGVVVPDWEGPIDLLIIGSDGRDGLTSGSYGDDDIAGDRSDTLMLLHVNAAHTDATLVSLPRDTMVPFPECTTADGDVEPAVEVAQINSAFDIGPYCTLEVVRELTGIDVDHFVVVNFDGFIDITNAVGGVEVCLAEDVDDPDSQLHLAAGSHTIQGEQALAFVRTRYGIGDGSDLGRIHTQQTYLSALARKVKSAQTLTNPVALFSLADAASRSLRVDEALADPGVLAGLAGALSGVDLSRMVLVQLPVQEYPDDPNRVEPVPDQTEALFAALRDDLPITLAGTNETDTDTDTDTDTGEETGEDTPAGAEHTGAVPVDAHGQTAADTTCAGR
ncbi:LCP family protein [Microbacterium resistens]|uniref:LCP family protein n=1 Tax=Microbacterium resistens TaxID=156977 RepID=UPI001C5614CB|nr:LCP family protein [Microbacterium resistens]